MIQASLQVLLPGAASAQDADPRQAVVVTASRLEQQITEVIPHTTVISRREIEESQATDLPSLLRREAGFEFSQNGGVGGVTSVYLRGGDGRQTLILVDGVRVGSATTGSTPIEHIMLDQVERVEIVRGNVSALFGAGAAGGVIQVFTRHGAGRPRGELRLTAGSRGTTRVAGGYGGAIGATRFNLDVSRFDTAGYSVIDSRLAPNANPDRDGYRNDSFNGQISHELARGHELGFRAYQSNGENFFDNAFGTRNDIHRSETELASYTLHSRNRFNPFWTSELSLSDGVDKIWSRTNANNPTRFNTRNRQMRWQNDFVLSPGHVLTAAVETQRQRVDSSTAYVYSGRAVRSELLAYNGRMGAHSLQSAVRNDHYSDFGRAGTWLAGYGYEINSDWKFTAMSSTGFIAPTFNQLFFPGFGNANLKPERSKSGEFGIQYATGEHLLRVAVYRTRYEDLIAGNPANNTGRARVEGIETSWTGRIERWDLRASLTMQDPVNETTGAPLQRRGTNFVNLVASTTAMGWRLGGELATGSDRTDTDIVSSGARRLPGYKTLNLHAERPLSNGMFIAARAENLFDEKYQTAHGYLMPGRGVFISAGWRQR